MADSSSGVAAAAVAAMGASLPLSAAALDKKMAEMAARYQNLALDDDDDEFADIEASGATSEVGGGLVSPTPVAAEAQSSTKTKAAAKRWSKLRVAAVGAPPQRRASAEVTSSRHISPDVIAAMSGKKEEGDTAGDGAEEGAAEAKGHSPGPDNAAAEEGAPADADAPAEEEEAEEAVAVAAEVFDEDSALSFWADLTPPGPSFDPPNPPPPRGVS